MSRRFGWLAVLVLLVFARPSLGIIKIWAGSSGNWTTAANWSPAGAPADGDDPFLIQADAINRTVTYNDTSPFLRIYNSIQIDSQSTGRMTLQQVNALTSLEAIGLQIGNFGPGIYNLTLGSGSFGSATMTSGSSLNVGADAFMNVGTFVQNTGAIVTANTTHLNVNTYRFNGGSFTGGVQTGTFIASGAQFDGILTVNNAMALPVNFTFGGSVLTHAPYTHLAGRSIGLIGDIRQVGATFNQSGNITVGGTGFGGIIATGGATWNHLPGAVSNIGVLQLGGNEGAGTYTIGNGATLTINKGFSAGLFGDGTFLQTGGKVAAAGSLLSRGGEDPIPSRMYWNMSGGSFTHSGDVVFGYQNAISAMYIQTAGAFQTARLTINDESTTYATANVSGGSFVVTSSTSNNGSFTASGIATVNLGTTVNGAGTIVVNGSADLSVGRIRQNSVSVAGNARIVAAQGIVGTTTSRVKSLTIEEIGGQVKGKFDLAFNKLIIDYDASSPIAAVKRYLRSGYNAGSWNGTGINSTTASIASPHNVALGSAESSQLFGANGGTFGDLFADNTSVLVRFTYYGDTDLNGVVNFDDYARIDAGFNNTASPRDWFHGDFNYDGVVNFDDYALIDLGFNTQSGAPRSVPEPSSLALLTGLAASAASFRRRRVR